MLASDKAGEHDRHLLQSFAPDPTPAEGKILVGM